MRMKQFEVLLLGLSLMALSCSKDFNYDDAAQESVQDSVYPYGLFEGEWQLSKYGMTCEGRIEVRTDEIVFDVPADYLFP